MPQYDKKVDTYISSAAPFAQKIMAHLRRLIHQACPQAEETLKWGMPYFEYHGMLCGMAGFRNHCAFGFRKAAIMKDPHRVMQIAGKTSMGSFGRLTSLKDLPRDRILLQYIREAARLNRDDVKLPSRTGREKTKPIEIPPGLQSALKKNKKTARAFDALSPSQKKEYTSWIAEAKTDPTRNKRVATAIEWISEGKPRNWKYAKK